MAQRPRIGELLVEQGHLSKELLEEALRIQRKPNEQRLLGQILVSRGYVTVAQVQAALAKQKAKEQQPA